MSGGCGSCGESALSYGNCLIEAMTVSSGNVELIPLDGSGEAATSGVGEVTSTEHGEAAEDVKASFIGKNDASEYQCQKLPHL